MHKNIQKLIQDLQKINDLDEESFNEIDSSIHKKHLLASYDDMWKSRNKDWNFNNNFFKDNLFMSIYADGSSRSSKIALLRSLSDPSKLIGKEHHRPADGEPLGNLIHPDIWNNPTFQNIKDTIFNSRFGSKCGKGEYFWLILGRSSRLISSTLGAGDCDIQGLVDELKDGAGASMADPTYSKKRDSETAVKVIMQEIINSIESTDEEKKEAERILNVIPKYKSTKNSPYFGQIKNAIAFGDSTSLVARHLSHQTPDYVKDFIKKFEYTLYESINNRNINIEDINGLVEAVVHNNFVGTKEFDMEQTMFIWNRFSKNIDFMVVINMEKGIYTMVPAGDDLRKYTSLKWMLRLYRGKDSQALSDGWVNLSM